MTEINDKAQLDIAAADDTDAVTSDTTEETVNTPEVDETFELSAAKKCATTAPTARVILRLNQSS